MEAGAFAAPVANHWAEGGAGATGTLYLINNYTCMHVYMYGYRYIVILVVNY